MKDNYFWKRAHKTQYHHVQYLMSLLRKYLFNFGNVTKML